MLRRIVVAVFVNPEAIKDKEWQYSLDCRLPQTIGKDPALASENASTWELG